MAGAKAEYIPSKRKSVSAAPRAGTAMLIRADLVYSVAYIQNEWESNTNSLIQSIPVAMGHGVLLTGAYVLPRTSGLCM